MSVLDSLLKAKELLDRVNTQRLCSIAGDRFRDCREDGRRREEQCDECQLATDIEEYRKENP